MGPARFHCATLLHVMTISFDFLELFGNIQPHFFNMGHLFTHKTAKRLAASGFDPPTLVWAQHTSAAPRYCK
ncbi:unnamed protein product [Strongylus vulgaris]|uniref:Uncharacterized protein n=1 Tax=Strongylus vulgaris TaxID=40348 RepID=A0A3P7J374_STRVU|nr:unnamed protein product [Strongylus vulgaris]